jgi:hypothetical protein
MDAAFFNIRLQLWPEGFVVDQVNRAAEQVFKIELHTEVAF